jgi:hypothetical protein
LKQRKHKQTEKEINMKIQTEETIRKGIDTNNTYLTIKQMCGVFYDDSLPHLKRALSGSYSYGVSPAQLSQVLRDGFVYVKTGKALPLISQKNSSGHWEINFRSACEIEAELEVVAEMEREVDSMESITKDDIVIETLMDALEARRAKRAATYTKEMDDRMNGRRAFNQQAPTIQ